MGHAQRSLLSLWPELDTVGLFCFPQQNVFLSGNIYLHKSSIETYPFKGKLPQRMPPVFQLILQRRKAFMCMHTLQQPIVKLLITLVLGRLSDRASYSNILNGPIVFSSVLLRHQRPTSLPFAAPQPRLSLASDILFS